MTTDNKKMPLTASLADYLEAIFQLEGSNRVARAKDIAGLVKVRSTSVTGALKTLAARGFINYSPYSYITLTAAGRDVARGISGRYRIVREFFTTVLHLGSEAADESARRIGNVIGDVAIDRLASLLEFLKVCPRTDTRWLEAFDLFCGHEPCVPDCRTCLENSMGDPGNRGKWSPAATYAAADAGMGSYGT